MTETQKALNKFRDTIVNEAKANLKSMGKDSTGKLSQSITGQVKEMPNSISMYFQMEAYGYFQDRGVKGTKSGRSESGFRFGTGSGPKGGLTNGIEKWVKLKGIKGRDKKGKFITQKSLVNAIVRSIWQRGIKPSLFFTKPFEKAFKKLPDTLITKYGLDAEQLFDSIMKETLTKK
jgi:hypothetical protein